MKKKTFNKLQIGDKVMARTWEELSKLNVKLVECDGERSYFEFQNGFSSYDKEFYKLFGGKEATVVGDPDETLVFAVIDDKEWVYFTRQELAN